ISAGPADATRIRETRPRAVAQLIADIRAREDAGIVIVEALAIRQSEPRVRALRPQADLRAEAAEATRERTIDRVEQLAVLEPGLAHVRSAVIDELKEAVLVERLELAPQAKLDLAMLAPRSRVVDARGHLSLGFLH